ncbi:MAG: O-antigen ligase family protein [Candidatus Jettenia sp.]|uniref:O-antigen ligase-related domain-containing protein n=1 Tax=Candidatus Jettenia caeni TaxID=247490 RepID=I3INA6_9BACT|nr:O-antigen ligase family protein [Candidatus Jettenia sp. AMX1]MBC6928082.1 O-antigen ligase family protein [Candidatus Jettenia sp.]WKZ14881.1 MAG: O-antigen ligase family protein [Candidatus Jettenia caeni]KAA0251183.1 MAG: O-antigen ligase family protein [Candidatus Jettenia sp. AMX1]MCE7879277.1 O-antigen ligase family protein [Candidatus Jettenia sp. AMX1]MCQ3927497.1 O-antigen ligase family protein [Candidatus Jettenia sp.]
MITTSLHTGLKIFLIFIASLITSFLGGYIFSLSIPIYFYAAFFAFLSIILTFFIQPFAAFVILLFIRPLIDPLSKYGIGQSVNLLAIFSILYILFLVIVLSNDKQKSWKPCISVYFYFYLFISVLSFINIDDFNTGVTFFFKLCSLIAIYVLAYHLVQNERDAHKIFLTVALSSVIPIGNGFLQYAMGTGVQQGMDPTLRINSTFVLSNPYAMFLCIIIFVLIHLLFFQKSISKKFNVVLCGLLFLAAISLVLTYTRAAWFAFLIGLIIYSIKEKRLRIYLLFMGILCVALLYDQIIERFSDLYTPRKYGTNSLVFRMDLAGQLLRNAFPKHYFLGFGLGTSEYVAFKYTTYPLPPHNDFLRILIESGTIGLICFLIFFYMNFKYYFNKIRMYPARSYNVFMLVLLSVYVVASLGQNIFFFVTTTGYVFCFLGVTQKLNDMQDLHEKSPVTI